MNVCKKPTKKAADSPFLLCPQTVFVKVGEGQLRAWRRTSRVPRFLCR